MYWIVLYEWFLNQREKHVHWLGPYLKRKLNKYPDKDENAFCASDGWFSKFKKRHGIRFIKICGEILSSDVALIITFINRYRAKVAEIGLMESQIYNVDETGLFFRCLPDRTYVSAFEETAVC